MTCCDVLIFYYMALYYYLVEYVGKLE